MSADQDRVPWWRRDLLDVLRLRRRREEGKSTHSGRAPLGRWNSLILANTSSRREAKAILFNELAEATRQGMPLDLALSHASQTAGEAKQSRDRGRATGAEGRHRPLDVLVSILIFILGQFAYFLYLLLAFRMADVERISAFLARRLLVLVNKGYSLSDAMRRLRFDFDEAEVRLVQAGEQWGNLPAALKRLGDFQVTEHRLTLQGSLVLYPLWLTAILTLLLTFCIVVILPKFKDIYDQLGAELPGPTNWLIDVANFAVTGMLGIIITFVAVVALTMAILRGVMNGNRLTKILLSLIVLTVTWQLLRPQTNEVGVPTGPFWWFWNGVYYMLVAIGATLTGSSPAAGARPQLSDATIVWGSILIIPVLILVLPYLLAGLEKLVLRWERFMRPKLMALPLVGRASRAEVEARWLGALSLAVVSNVPDADAVRSAGEIVGGRLNRRSRAAALLVESGNAIGAACIRARVLRSTTNHQLALLDNRPNYSARLHGVADDAAVAAFETIHRTGRVVESVSILMLGLVAAAFAIAMYLPLFTIPTVIGREADEIRSSSSYHDSRGQRQ